ncbi:hypothetical protein BGW39_004033 [Mortierella sp. 14UC]|nr:hypothetical protein BGW39_004033 [Mortierella sp. 14UC]
MGFWSRAPPALTHEYQESVAHRVRDILTGESHASHTNNIRDKQALKALQRPEALAGVIEILKNMPDPDHRPEGWEVDEGVDIDSEVEVEQEAADLEKGESSSSNKHIKHAAAGAAAVAAVASAAVVANKVSGSGSGSGSTPATPGGAGASSTALSSAVPKGTNIVAATTIAAAAATSAVAATLAVTLRGPHKKAPKVVESEDGSTTTTTTTKTVVRFHPSKDTVSSQAYWWGYEIFIPQEALSRISSAQDVSSAFLGFLGSVGLVVPAIVPFLGYIAAYVGLEFAVIKAQNEGKGVILASTCFYLTLPATITGALFVSRLVWLRKHGRQHGLGRTGLIYWSSFSLMLIGCISLIADLLITIRSSDDHVDWEVLLASASMLLAWILAIVLNHEEHKYSIRSSDFILAYYLIATLGMGAVLWLSPTQTLPHPTSSTLHWFWGSLVLGLIVEALPREWTKVQQTSNSSVFEKANLISRLSFHYIQPIMTIGYSRPLLMDDLKQLMPERIRSENAYKDLEITWHRQERRFEGLVPKERQERERPWLLMRTIAGTFGWVGWAPIVLTRVISTTLIYLQPVLLGRILDFMKASSSSSDAPLPSPQPLSYGIFLATLMFLVSLMSSVMGAQLLQLNAERGMEIRSGLIGLIYRKSLKLSPEARQTQTAGAISNHMSVDAEKWITALNTLPQWVSAPIELLVALWMLYHQLGWCSLVGLFTVVGLIPIQNKVSDVFSEIKNTKLTTMDSRIRLVTEMLTSIKTVKLYAWEDAFKAKIAGYREIEMAVLRRFGVVYSGMTLIFSTTMLMSLLSFGIYAAVGGPGGTPGEITPHVIFVSLSLFGLLSKPISSMDTLLSNTTSILVATRRIQAFLLSEELPVNSVTSVQGGVDDDVVVWDADLSWHKQVKNGQVNVNSHDGDENTPLLTPSETVNTGKSDAPTLNNIDFRLRAGSLTAVVGRIGSGKSSLLNALIGDMYKYRGSVQVRGSIAYVSQQAWILHSTVKDNILFGKPLDQERYDAVLHACCLQQDLDMLPAGDQTEIGERGINLSGGQKQRVALARAAYQDADIYLLDDSLSAVDAHVDQQLWRNLIGPRGMLKDKTRLLVTHGLHHLSEVDQVMVMKDGTISEKGSFDELLAAKKGFYQLNLEFSVTSSKQRRKSANNNKNATSSSAESTSEAGIESDADSTVANTVAAAVNSSDLGPKIYNDKKDSNAAGAGLVAAEKMVSGGVGWRMFLVYAKAASYTNIALVVILYILVEAAQVGTSFWLRYWSDAAGEDNEGNDSEGDKKHYSVTQFLVIYAAFTLAYMAFNVVLFYVANVLAAVRGARYMHDRLLANLLRQPMAFFDVTPVGRIINRFSTDVDAIDESIIWNLIDVVYCLVAIGGTLIVISVSTPQFLWAIPPLALCYLFIQSYFLASSQALKRFMSVSKSPLYQHFSETLAGVSTIRAMAAGEKFIAKSGEKADLSAETNLAFGMANRWLKVRLEFLAALIVFDAALLAVLSQGRISASLVGLSLTYAMNVTGDITYLVRSWAEMSNQLISVERIEEYVELRQEAPAITGVCLPENWPAEGRIVFRNYSARYREGLEPVLKNVSFEVIPGEKVGIVGRTGAGKSSLTLALFRMIEAADSYWARASSHDAVVCLSGDGLSGNGGGGSIEIDGVDISTLGLKTLRQHLAIIPQDPTLFAGTVRDNLDPLHQSNDTDLWTALERAHLKDHISSLPQGLSFEVSSNGENFSMGQRSLICLARALLRKTKILVLDEATAAVDVETDELIQRTIREEFRDRTILTIAHRIKTVMDSDRVLVLEGGKVEEFEAPGVLVRRREGLFFRLAEQAGEVH